MTIHFTAAASGDLAMSGRDVQFELAQFGVQRMSFTFKGRGFLWSEERGWPYTAHFRAMAMCFTPSVGMNCAGAIYAKSESAVQTKLWGLAVATLERPHGQDRSDSVTAKTLLTVGPLQYSYDLDRKSLALRIHSERGSRREEERILPQRGDNATRSDAVRFLFFVGHACFVFRWHLAHGVAAAC